MVRITSKVDGYRRCGVLHPARPTDYPDGQFTGEQLAILKADPLLAVEEIPEETTSGDAPEKQKAKKKAE
ncbi:MAG: HI1506-related protein [Bacillota bacterium]